MFLPMCDTDDNATFRRVSPCALGWYVSLKGLSSASEPDETLNAVCNMRSELRRHLQLILFVLKKKSFTIDLQNLS